MTTSIDTGHVTAKIDALGDYLTRVGVLPADEAATRIWRTGLHHVPRHLFVPTRAWAEPMDDRPEHEIDRDRDPAGWLEAIYTNTAIITQRGDGTADVADTHAAPTSSLSCPYVAAEFLRLLDVEEHHRILEIGTGTGWTAAMLAWHTSDDQVVTVEIDSAIAAQAQHNLAAAGFSPTVITADGTLGHPEQGPYDRVHVTCGVREIPYAWVEQTRPGGLIAAPYMVGRYGEQLALYVLDDGTAIGRFNGGATFMMMRNQRPARPTSTTSDGHTTTGRLNPRTIPSDYRRGFGLYLSGCVPDLILTGAGWEQFSDTEWGWLLRLRTLDATSWAIAAASAGDAEITQGGPRHLWDELQTAYMDWIRRGRPGPDRLGMTVTEAGQLLWLDAPGNYV
ncbi:methyltransferase domain-containing protein [Bailinhaonella thermotolerans]|uniref:Protein-L-isoaspartate O-methyltransferase n=1 Tax=Bailinhaonella thermotolerans TaxID=1070861 RepID=A0A3A4A5S7_9ACTN|nr:methyltransferase domain-containing protein [Bailinhaonella thermotolerans]RJL23199.1 methyltransferase domain-containing protein [Bailinhaonella thermotolerans]